MTVPRSAPRPQHFDPAPLEAFALEKMIASRLPGMVLLLLEDGQVVHRRGLGFADLERRVPPGADTRFGIGSITKVFTALAVMQLCEQGALGLDDTVAHHLEPLGLAGSDLRVHGQPVTLRHLLSHSSGLPALGYSESKMSGRWFPDGYPVASLADLFTFMAGATDVPGWAQAPPGKRWLYLNEGYLLLGAVIEAATGRPYREHLREALLEPLGMTRSTFLRAEVEADADRAAPYLLDEHDQLLPGSNLYSELPAAGGLVSTAADLGRLAQMLLAGGVAADGARVIEAATLAAMTTAVVDLPARELELLPDAPETRECFGLGFYLHEGFFGVDIVGHGGGVMGGTSYLAVTPDRGLGVVLLANGHGYPLRQLALAALANGLGHDLETLPFVRLDRLLDALTGHYASFRRTIEASVRRHGDALELTLAFRPRSRRLWLLPEAIDEGRARFAAFSGGRRLPVTFTPTPHGTELRYERYALRQVQSRA